MSDKQTRYSELVKKRKQCTLCPTVFNQSGIDGGKYDTHDSIGAWSLWHGDLDADVLLIGQDWGSVVNYRKTGGYPTSSLSIGPSPTNRTLLELISILGYSVCEFDGRTRFDSKLFFTNGLLCLKSKDSESSKIDQRAINVCIGTYLKELTEIINPKVVISLALPTFLAIRKLYKINAPDKMGVVLDSSHEYYLGTTRYFPVGHCGGLGLRNRPLVQQKNDWRAIRAYLDTVRS